MVGVVVIIIGPGLVVLEDGALDVVLLLAVFLHRPFHSLFQGSVEEEVIAVLFGPQHIVGTPAHDQAGAFVGHFADHIKLSQIEFVIQRECVRAISTYAQAGGQGIQEAVGGFGFCLTKHFLGKTAFLGRTAEELFVIERNVQRFGQLLADGQTAAAIFTAESDDDFFHMHTPCGSGLSQTGLI